MKTEEKSYNIPVEAPLKVVSGKWKTVILCHLTSGTDADQQLKRAMPKISQKMLTQQLRELEKDGVIHRIVYNQVSPKEVCELNEFGWSIKADLDQMFA